MFANNIVMLIIDNLLSVRVCCWFTTCVKKIKEILKFLSQNNETNSCHKRHGDIQRCASEISDWLHTKNF